MVEALDSLIQQAWEQLASLPLADHIMFPSLVALGSFHINCWLFTLYDIVQGRKGVGTTLKECALPQTIVHAVLNGLTFYAVRTRHELPQEAPTFFELMLGLLGCYFVGDLLIYVEHVMMHKVPFLRHNIHATHHKFTSPMFSFNAGWVHPIEIAIAAGCELAYPFSMGLHPMILWIFLWTWVFWLVEEHSGNDVWWSLWHLAPLIGGGSPPHNLHHAPHLTKNFGFVFSCWDRMFGTFQAPPEVDSKKIH